MEFTQLIQTRYSVRTYKPDPIPQDKLRQVLDAARWAPTANNRQPFQIIVLHTRGREVELARLYPHEWFLQAPLIIGMCALSDRAWCRMDGANYAAVDATIAMDHLILAAANLGLGTCWVAAFNPEVARTMLNLPASVEPVAFTPLGYPADDPSPKERKALNDLVRYEIW